jgi:hypothetical protein
MRISGGCFFIFGNRAHFAARRVFSQANFEIREKALQTFTLKIPLRLSGGKAEWI